MGVMDERFALVAPYRARGVHGGAVSPGGGEPQDGLQTIGILDEHLGKVLPI